MKKRARAKFDAEEWQRFDGSWTEFVKAKKKAYLQRLDVKARKKAYLQRPDVKARRKAYHQRPDVKARKKAYMKDYDRRRRASCLNLNMLV